MYKDVWKRILAFMLTVCLIVTLVQWPESVEAAAPNYFTYQMGNSANSTGPLEQTTAAVVFTVSQAAGGAGEILDSISFDANIEDGSNARADVTCYTNPTDGTPVGQYRWTKTVTAADGSMQETTTLDAGMPDVLPRGTRVGIVIELTGATFSSWASAGAGQSYAKSGGGWTDLDTAGKCAAIRCYTRDGEKEEQQDSDKGVIEKAKDLIFPEKETPEPTGPREIIFDLAMPTAESPQDLDDKHEFDKHNMVIAKGWTGEIRLKNPSGIVSWRTEDETIAKVESMMDDRAVIKGLELGTTKIIATDDIGEVTADITVTRPMTDAEVTLSMDHTVYNGQQQIPEITVTLDGITLERTQDYLVECTFNNTVIDYPTLNTEDYVNAGTYTFKIIGQNGLGENGGQSGNLNVDFTIDRKPIDDESVEVLFDRNKWEEVKGNGNTEDWLQCIREVWDNAIADESNDDSDNADLESPSAGKKLLLPGDMENELDKDYLHDYYLRTETRSETGDNGIVIVGIGNYTGERFCGTPVPLKDPNDEENSAQIALSHDTFVYTGEECLPTPTVTVRGVVLSESDFDVKWGGDTINATKADSSNAPYVEITGKDQYSGTVKEYYKILPKDINNADQEIPSEDVKMEVFPAAGTGDDSVPNPVLVLTYNGMTLEEGVPEGDNKDYTIDPTSKKQIMEGDVATNRATCWIEGHGNYIGRREVGEYSWGKNIDTYYDIEDIADCIYTGEAQEPFIRFKPDGAAPSDGTKGPESLVKDVDYKLYFKNNVEVGTATAVVVGIGEFGGSIPKEFNIVSASDQLDVYFVDANGDRITGEAEVAYSPNLIDMQPKVRIDCGGKTLEEGEDKDYTVAYKVTVGGQGGQEDQPIEAQADSANPLLADSTINLIGKATAEITIKNKNYAGSKTIDYEIVQRDIGASLADGTLLLDMDLSYVYTGGTISPKPSVGDPNVEGDGEFRYAAIARDLKENDDYEIQYSPLEGDQRIDPGSNYEVFLRGTGNYTGDIEKKFSIIARDVYSLHVEVDKDAQTNLVKGYRDDNTYEGKYIAMVWNEYDIFHRDANQLKLTITNDEGDVLREDGDYELSYENETHVSKEGDVAQVTIEGRGAYEGSERTLYYLVADDLGKFDIDVHTKKDYVYTGAPVTLDPSEVSVEDTKGFFDKITLEYGVDYNVSYPTDEKRNNTHAADPKKVGEENAPTIRVEQLPFADFPSKNGCYAYKPKEEDGSVEPLEGVFKIMPKDINDPEVVCEEIEKPYKGDIIELEDRDIALKYNGMDLIYSADGTKDYMLLIDKDPDKGPEVGENTDVGDPNAHTTIVGTNDYAGTRDIHFTIKGKDLSDDKVVVKCEVADMTYTGKDLYPAIKLWAINDEADSSQGSMELKQLVEGEDYYYDKTIQYPIGPDGRIPNRDAGVGSVTLTGLGEYKGSTRVVEFTIHQRDISKIKDGEPASYDEANGTVTVSDYNHNVTYTSEPIEPKPEVEVSYTENNDDAVEQEQRIDRQLEESKDYTLSYENNTDAGLKHPTGDDHDQPSTAKININGTGNYTGTYTAEFTIDQKDISEDQSDITMAEIPTQEYTGYAVRPEPQIDYEYATGKTYRLKRESGDYETTYENEIEPSIVMDPENPDDPLKNKLAHITVKGTGNFTGKRDKYFAIGYSIASAEEFEVTYDKSGEPFVYTGAAYTPKVTVREIKNDLLLQENKDYKVEYKNNIDAGTATITVTGTGSYAGVREMTFEILPKPLTDVDVVLSIGGDTTGNYKAPYTGKEIRPEIKLTVDGVLQIEGVDYTATFGNNTNLGTATVVIEPKNANFTGTLTGYFQIVPAQIGNGSETPSTGFRVSAIEPQPWTGSQIRPKPSIWNYKSGVTLQEGVDYDYSYENNVNVGTAYVIITAKAGGNYTGSVRVRFLIKSAMTNAVVTVTPKDAKYWHDTKFEQGLLFDKLLETDGVRDVTSDQDDWNQVPDGGFHLGNYLNIQVTIDGEVIPEEDGSGNKNYEVTFEDNDFVGTAKVRVKGKGAFAGEATADVMILGDLESELVEVVMGDVPYTGKPVTPDDSQLAVSFFDKRLRNGGDFIIANPGQYTDPTPEDGPLAICKIEAIPGSGFFGSTSGEFRIVNDPRSLVIEGIEDSYRYTGQPIKPVPTRVTTADGSELDPKDYRVVYGDNTNAGTGNVSIFSTAEDGVILGTRSFEILPWDMSELTVTSNGQATIPDQEYTSQEILPKIELTAKDGATVITIPEKDFAVSGTNNVEVGTAHLFVEGRTDNVTGSARLDFQIVPKSLAKPAGGEQDRIFVELSPRDFVYDGTSKTPDVHVEYQFGDSAGQRRSLTESIDYTLSFSGNQEPGTATVTITGINNYKDQRTEEFQILQADLTAAQVEFPNGPTYYYMGKDVEVRPEARVTLNGVELVPERDYTVSYENNTVVGTAYMKITGTGNYKGELTAGFTIVPHPIDAEDIVAEIPNVAYTGQPVVVLADIYCGDYKLVSGQDYNVTYKDEHQEIGEHAATITGIGGFTGSRDMTYRIAPSVEAATIVGLLESYPYIGRQLTEEDLGITEVRLADKVLVPGQDYKFEYPEGDDGMTARQTHTIQLVGMGEYGGKKDFTFEITPKNLTDYDIEVKGFVEEMPYTEDVKQDVTVSWHHGDMEEVPLVEGTDYTVQCVPESGVNWVLEVTGKGNFDGTIRKEFSLLQADITKAVVSGLSTEYIYTGSEIKPEPEVTYEGEKLTPGKDYTVTYENNIDVGVGKIKITANEKHYTGTLEYPFNISRRSINLIEIEKIEDQAYTGESIKPEVTLLNNGKAMSPETDYDLSYENNRFPGEASMSVSGKGNYKDTRIETFVIIPASPKNLAVTGVSQRRVTLSWKSTGAVTGYEIFRAEGEGNYSRVGITKKLTFTDMAAELQPGRTYRYQIRSYVNIRGKDYYGVKSEEVKATTRK